MIRFLVLVSLVGCSGCGVDATRSMWSQRWTAPGGPPVVHAAKRTAEITGKAVITPAAVTVDVLTDETTWLVVLWCAEAAGECALRCACECH